jgi:hypothetical protein
MKNKKGWQKIVEAFLSVLLIAAVLVLVINQQNTKPSDSSSRFYNYETYIIRGIEFNDTLRNEIIGVSGSALPLTSDNQSFPLDVKNQILATAPSSLLCAAEICYTNSTCDFWQNINKDVYAQKIFITSSLQTYNPEQLKLFCWLK